MKKILIIILASFLIIWCSQKLNASEDTTPPEFTNTIDVYMKSTNNVKSANDILKYFTAVDDVDGLIDLEIDTDTFTGNGNKAGTYSIIVRAEDSSGNSNTHEVTVKVKNHSRNDWIILNDSILVIGTNFGSRSDIVILLSEVGLVQASANSVTTYKYDTYTDNRGKEGIYVLEFNVTEPTAVSNDYSFMINVGNVPLTDTDVIPKKLNPFNKFINNNLGYIFLATIALGVLVAIKMKKQKKGRKK